MKMAQKSPTELSQASDALTTAEEHNARTLGVESARDDAERDQATLAGEREYVSELVEHLEQFCLDTEGLEIPGAVEAVTRAGQLVDEALEVLGAALKKLA